MSSPEKKKETPPVVPGAETCREITNGHSESTGETIAKETISARTESDKKVGEASSVAEVKCPNS